MGQLGFFDADKRLAALSAKGDPLEAIDRLVPWESFRADIEAVVLTPEEMRKSSAGRKPLDAIVMFRMLLQRREALKCFIRWIAAGFIRQAAHLIYGSKTRCLGGRFGGCRT